MLVPRIPGCRLTLFTNYREGFFSETGLPVYGVLGNLALSCVACCGVEGCSATQDKLVQRVAEKNSSRKLGFWHRFFSGGWCTRWHHHLLIL